MGYFEGKEENTAWWGYRHGSFGKGHLRDGRDQCSGLHSQLLQESVASCIQNHSKSTHHIAAFVRLFQTLVLINVIDQFNQFLLLHFPLDFLLDFLLNFLLALHLHLLLFPLLLLLLLLLLSSLFLLGSSLYLSSNLFLFCY